ncbi:S-layer homology domain-containing protein [Paenibacillus athensensis]|uniref:S-layer homology domain-containing protein n=1 Tax=Paenibacillus athensensis TaxID=1967502 RepID=A0A4Y8Q858_9BACL|nr:S-layer homology domain-containing protein [Paenibacillus athensensis]MCD1260331.1 S-layer homology domain-containing protein [Paenibacillus athensensis]
MFRLNKAAIWALVVLISLSGILTTGGGRAQAADSGTYVMIKNDYRGTYLYEDAADQNKVKRGTPSDMSDPTYQWQIEETGGVKRLKNRSTGHYMSVVNVTEWDDPVTSIALDDTTMDFDWNIQDAGAGKMTLESVKNPGSYLHMEAAGLDFAECTNGVQASWGSAQWIFEEVQDNPYVRIKNDYRGSYLYEDEADQNKVKRGMPTDTNDPAYQWLIEETGGVKRIKNRATGHYMSIVNVTEWDDPVTSIALDDTTLDFDWSIAEAEPGKMTIESVKNPGSYLHVEAAGLDFAECTNGVQASWGSAHWILEPASTVVVTPTPTPTPTPGAGDKYVRIQSRWKSMYLYEDNNQVKYGNPSFGDTASHWEIEDFGDHKRIKNRATGHYMTIQNGLDYVESTEVQDDALTAQWDLTLNGDGYSIIKSAAQNAIIHLENLRKYAQYSDIDANWFSPQWKLIGVPDDVFTGHTVRMKNQWQGSYLYEEDGKVKYGNVPADDLRSHWLIAVAGEHRQIRNAATGHYIAIEHHDSHLDPVEAIVIEPSWTSAQWDIKAATNDGFYNIENVYKTDFILHIQDQTDYAQASNLPPDWGSGQWALEDAPVVPPVIPDSYVRLKNKKLGTYLYENSHQAVLYGTPPEDDASSHWIVESRDGHQVIRNRATQHVLSIQGLLPFVESVPDPAPQSWSSSLWDLVASPDLGYVDIRNVGDSDMFVHLSDSFGYAQYDFVSTEAETVSWSLEDAPGMAQVYEPQVNTERSDVVFDDTNTVRVKNNATGTYLLEGDNGALTLGSVAVDDLHSQWLSQQVNGHKRLKNVATGHFVAADGGTVAALASAAAGAEWYLTDTDGSARFSGAAGQAGTLAANAGGTAVELTDASSSVSASWQLEPVTADVQYEAEESFYSAGQTVGSAGLGFSGRGYIGDFTSVGSLLTFTVYAQQDGVYNVLTKYTNTNTGAKTLSRSVNGIADKQVTFAASGSAGWKYKSETLKLRAGLNTVTYERTATDSGSLQIDALVLHQAVNKAARGATTMYTEYEAEAAATTGTLVGPTRKYREIASEASGRQAVKLDQTGQYVEFTLTKPTNSLVVRYTIPDAPAGGGLEAPIALYVNGVKKQDIQLTSKHSWVYGSYPWSNDPSLQLPHRFFDESRVLIGDVPAGAKLRLQVDQTGAAAYRIIDLIDTEMAPQAYAQTPLSLSITQYGAVAGDGQDDTAALQAAIAAAKQAGRTVWIPAGTFDFNGEPLNVSNVTIRGAGPWYSVLQGIGAGFNGQGGRVQMYDFAIFGASTGRNDASKESGFDGNYGPGSVIQNVWIEHRKTGIWVNGPVDDMLIVGNRIRNTYADGINLHGANSNIHVEQNAIRNSGDDGIALWSDRAFSTTPNHNHVIRFNTVQLPWLASNIAVYGGRDNVVQDNIVADTIAFGGGINVSSNHTPVAFSGTTTVERNTLLRTGGHEYNFNKDFGAIWVNVPEKIDGKVLIRYNDVYDSSYQGLSVQGPGSLTNATIAGNIFEKTGTWGMQIQGDARGSAAIHNIIRDAVVGDSSQLAGGTFTVTAPAAMNDAYVPSSLAVTLDAQLFRPESGGAGTGGTGGGGVSGGDSGTGSQPTTSPQPTTKPQQPAVKLGADALTVKSTTVNGKVQTSVAVDGSKLVAAFRELLAAGNGTGAGTGAGAGKTIAIDTASTDATLVVEVPAQALGEAAGLLGGGKLAFRAADRSYELPLSSLKLDELAAGMGKSTADLTVSIRMEKLTGSVADELNGSLEAQGVTPLGDAVDFSVTVGAQGAEPVTIHSFGSTYVTRTLVLSGVVDADQATAVAVDPQTGAASFVPALFEKQEDGTTAVVIKRNSNSLYTVVSHSASFADTAGHWAQRDIDTMASKLIVNGIADGAFAPDRSVTRAEFVALLVRSLGLSAASDAASGFTDVKAGDWYAGAVATAVEAGLADGFADGSFRPSATITREQMAVLIARAISYAGTSLPAGSDGVFADEASIGGWAREAVASLAAVQLVNGMSDGSFAPQSASTRAEAVTMLKRFLQFANFMD